MVNGGEKDVNGESIQNSRPSFNEYIDSLRLWLYHYHTWNAWCGSYQAFCLQQEWSKFQQISQSPPAAPQAEVQQASQQQHSNSNERGGNFRMASLWKRLAAELLDFFFLFMIKVILTLLAIDSGWRDWDGVDVDFLLNDPNEVDMKLLMNTMRELMLVEFVNRICIVIFETLCLRRGVAGNVGGTTPGKRIMKLQVISCDLVVENPDGSLFVMPANNLGLKRAFIRSFLKNFSMAFLFPVALTALIFHHGRAGYDIVAGTIVVEKSNGQQ